MAERIKGLQIDLSMRDMGVSKTLAGIKREFRSLNSSLKLSSNNFKYGEKSASSYKARMNDLDRAIKVGTSNLGELEKQYKQVAQSQGANSAKAVRLQTEYNKQANAINAMKDEYGRLNQYYRENFSMAGRLSNSFRNIGTSMQSVGGQAQKMGGKLTNGITKPALMAGGALAGIAITKGFGRLVEIDTAKAKLSALGNSAKDTNTIMDNALESVKGTSFGMGEAATTAANAVAAGIKPGKQLTQYLTNTADAAAIAGADMSEMGSIMNKVQTQNKAYNGELQQLSDRGLPVYQWLAKEANISAEEVTEMASKGEISSKMLQNAIKNNIGGAAKEMGQKSFTAALANMWAALARVGAAFLDAGGKGGGFFSKLKPLMNNLTDTFDNMGPQAEQWGVALGNAFGKVIDGITGIVNWYQGLDSGTQKVFGGLAKWLGITLVTMGPVLTIFGKMASTIGGMFSGMSSLIQFFIRHNGAAKVSAASQAIWNGVTATARGIANGYRYAMAALTTSQTVQAIKSKIAATAMTIWTGVTKAAALATRGLGLAIRFMTGPIGIVITAVGLLVAGITHLWRTNATFRNIVMSVWQAVQTKIMSVVGSITSIIRNNIPLIKGIFSNTFNGVRNIVNGSLNIVLGITKVFSGLFTGNFRKMWSGVQQIFSGFIRVIKGIFQASFVGQIVRLAVIMGTKIKGTFSNLAKVSRVIFSALGTWMSKKWTSIKDNTVGKAKLLWSGVKAWWSNLGKNTRTTMSSIGSFMSKKWQSIKSGTVNKAKATWSGVKSWWSNLNKNTRSTMNSVGSFMSKKWQSIKSGTVNKAKSTWSGVKNWWSNLNKNTRATMNSVGKFMSSKWSSIKSNTVNRAKNTWSGVKGAWGSLSKGTRSTMNSVGGFMSKKWQGIKNGTVNLVTGMKNKVTGVMNKMGDVIKSVTGNIKGFFSGMIDKVKGGLNKLIGGVNWVGEKLGMDKLPEIKLHTGTEHTNTTTNVVKNGKIARDTFATVGDKGRGNGPNGFRHEAIKYPNGKMALTPNRDTTAFLPKGSSVMNGAQTHSMLNSLPRFNGGTDKKKKDWNFAENALSSANAIKKDATKKIVSGGKAVVSKSLGMAAKGKKWLEDTVGDVMDWIKKPGKLLDKVLESVGLDLSGFGIPKGATLPYDMMKGMFGKLKKAAIDTIKGWMEEQEGGDGDAAWLLKHPVLQRFGHYTGGLMFNGGRHYGIDFGMPTGTKIRALTDGTITQAGAVSGGGGNQITLKEPGGKYFQWYMHLSKILAKQGQKVKTGDVLGLSGNTGNSTTPHLHIQRMKGRVGNDTALSNVMSWLKGLGGGGKKAPNKWRGTIRKAAKRMKVKLTKAEENGIVAQIARESNGDAGVTQGNIGDINNLRGTPAQGLLQYVPSTFKSYAVKGHGNIKSGYDQLLAFFNNKNWRRDLPYGKSGWGPTGGRRFATGGLINSPGWYNIAEGGHPEWVIPTDPSRNSDAMKLLALAAQDIDSKSKGNKRPNQMRTPSTSNNNDNEMINFMARQLEATQRQVELLTQLVASNQRLEQKPTGVSEQDMSKAQGKRAQMMAYNMGGAF